MARTFYLEWPWYSREAAPYATGSSAAEQGFLTWPPYSTSALNCQVLGPVSLASRWLTVWVAQEPDLPLQCLDQRRRNNPARSAHPARRVRLRTLTCCPRHCRAASLLNQDPGCLRSRLKRRRSGLIVGKPETLDCARSPAPLPLAGCDSCSPKAGRKPEVGAAPAAQRAA